MKKNIIYLIIILLILTTITIVLVTTNTKTTLRKELRDFAITDTAIVDKIFMVDKANKKVELERKGNKWMVNHKYNARQDAINILLETFLLDPEKMKVATAKNNQHKALKEIDRTKKGFFFFLVSKKFAAKS
jgi:hypothetical protein